MYASNGRLKYPAHWRLFDRVALAILYGLVTNVLITVPPQHAKSTYWSEHFTSWYIGRRPEKRLILSSYEGGYAATWGRKTRDLLEAHGNEIFGVQIRQDSHAADEWNLVGRLGGMITAGIGGPITGHAATGGIIVDDPIKNAEEAASAALKEKHWDWWDTTIQTRVHEGAFRIVLMTRWAEDDLVGRILKRAKETGQKWIELRLPALAEADEVWPEWNWHREKGQVLAPELFSQATMEERRDNTLPFWWATLYQQRPYPREGGEIKAGWFEIVDEVPKLDMEVRAWDPAASDDKDAKQSASVRMGRVGWDPKTTTYYITDSTADWMSSGKRDATIKTTAEKDGKAVRVVVEQEPGSGGKSQVASIASLLEGYRVIPMPAATGGSKVLRADPLASKAQAGFIKIKRGDWNDAFLDQIRSFPGGKLVDRVDAAAHAFNWLSAQKKPMAPFYAKVGI